MSRPSVEQAVRAAAVRLNTAGVPDAAGDARRLMMAALGLSPAQFVVRARDPLDGDAATAFEAFVA
ncbi:MAG: peptide chain release factor N(5)-glutamine methyltransferase, partial [Pseudomonadota bacterium]